VTIGNQEYKTVVIGKQAWMAENLNVDKFRNGDMIYEIKPGLKSKRACKKWKKLGNKGTPACCYYYNYPENGEEFGRLYNWFAVNDKRNIAPEGWHVPTDEEWKELETHLGMSQEVLDTKDWHGTDEGNKMKAKKGWSKDGNGTNKSGFTALPGGVCTNLGIFAYMGEATYFWSATENNTNNAWYRFLHCSNSAVFRSYNLKQCGFSVRLLRD
jgi:uncharacterized protein (TIGR02145 family)